MWDNPWLLLDPTADYFGEWLDIQHPFENPYPEVEGIAGDSENGHNNLRMMCRDLARILQQNPPRSVDFKRALIRYFLDWSASLKEQNVWSLIPAMYDAVGELVAADTRYGIVAMMIISTLRSLAGNEKRQLIGTRRGSPAWKTLRHPITKRQKTMEKLFLYTAEEGMRYIDQSDVGLMPEPENWLNGIAGVYNWPEVDPTETNRLMEDAYYHQRYLVHPEGAYVKVKHFGPIQGLTLKVKAPGLADPHYHDFLVVLEAETTHLKSSFAQTFKPGQVLKTLVAFDGTTMTGQSRVVGGSEESLRGHHYLAWMTALIYHDLVTATEIGRSKKIGGVRVVRNGGRREEEPTWVYIPRRIRKEMIPPRIESDNPRFTTPHNVSGHLRRANPTEKHLEELRKFEEKTGLRVLDLLKRNPGYTFVRPHISPSVEGVIDLPKFIHARLQSDIERLMHPL